MTTYSTLDQLREAAIPIPGCGKRSITMIFATLNPDLAADILTHNTSNRKLSPGTARKYANEMVRGEWLSFTGEPFLIGSDGSILNAQHRATACITAHTNVPGQLFIFGIDPSAFHKLDQGKKRSYGDVLNIRNYDSPNCLSSAVSLLFDFERGHMSASSGSSESIDLKDEVLERHESGLIESLKIGKTFDNDRAMWSVAIYLGRNAHGTRLDELIEQVRTHDGLQSDTPAKWLHNTEARVWRASGTHIRSPRKLAHVIMAFNAEITKKRLTSSAGWDGTTPFPMLKGDTIYRSQDTN